MTHSHDGAERLWSIAEAGQVLKQYVYAPTNSGADLRVGQVHKSTRTNVVGAPFNTTVKIEENFVYAGGQGRISQKNTIMRLADNTPREQFTQDFGYDTLGRVVSETYPRCTSVCTGDAPRTVTYTYQKGRLFSVPGFVDSTATVPGITYHPSGLAKEIRHSNNTFDVWTADANQMARPGEILTTAGSPAGTALWRTGAYGYDGSGNIKAMGVDAFRYDSKGRLTHAELYDGPQGTGGGTLQFEDASFDIFGNLTVLTLTRAGNVGVVQNIPTNTTNRWTSATYDNAGNMTNVAGVGYEYDAFNNLKRWTSSPAVDHSFVYTAGDERLWEVTPGLVKSSWALRGLDGTIRREYEVGGGSFANYTDTIYRERTPVATVGPGGSLHLHSDHLGNLRMSTNSAGSQWWYREYFPHGRLATKLSPADTEQHTFTGHERDVNVRIANGCSGGAPCNDWRDNADGDDLDNMHARYYKPQWGRFLSVDSGRDWNLGQPQSWNRYSYVRGRPINLVDPTGKWATPWEALDLWSYQQSAAEWSTNASAFIQSPSLRGAFVAGTSMVTAMADGAALLLPVVPAYGGASIAILKRGTVVLDGVQTNRTAGHLGEDFLQATFGGERWASRQTSLGRRFIDNLADGVARESKVGRTALGSRVQQQIAKDIELMTDPLSGVRQVEWHFFPGATGVGPTRPLRQALERAGIGVTIH